MYLWCNIHCTCIWLYIICCALALYLYVHVHVCILRSYMIVQYWWSCCWRCMQPCCSLCIDCGGCQRPRGVTTCGIVSFSLRTRTFNNVSLHYRFLSSRMEPQFAFARLCIYSSCVGLRLESLIQYWNTAAFTCIYTVRSNPHYVSRCTKYRAGFHSWVMAAEPVMVFTVE